jgi:5,10-methylene-tetrahydrofolate dehydrogenase/methenyl tetrahydrofolate cyclohydrolase
MNETSQTQRLRDKNVVVIGASRGPGRDRGLHLPPEKLA